MKLGLGTAQFGLDYGVSNTQGRTQPDEAMRILDLAKSHGVRVIDTATAYGASEAVLGQYFDSAKNDFNVVTKIPKVSNNPTAGWVKDTVLNSQSRLHVTIHAVLVHSADDLLGAFGTQLFESLSALKSEGLVKKIGASIYSPDQIDSLLENYDLQLIQVPFNIFDQRLLQSGHLQKMKQKGVEIHSRSAFLQGLLLMEPSKIPSYLSRFADHLTSYQNAVINEGLTLVEAALAFPMHEPLVDAVICGVNDAKQFNELLRVANRLPERSRLNSLLRFASDDLNLIDPTRWGLKQSPS